MAYRQNIGRGNSQAKTPVQMTGSPMQQKNLNFTNSTTMAPSSNIPDDFRTFMNKPFTMEKGSGKKGFNLNLSDVTFKNTAPGGAAAMVATYLNKSKDVKQGKSNLSQAKSNVASTQGDYNMATALRNDAENTYNNYGNCGIDGFICGPTQAGIEAGTVTVDDFISNANVNLGNFTQPAPGQPYVQGPNYMNAAKVNSSISAHESNLNQQSLAEQALKKSKRNRTTGTIVSGVLGAAGNYLISKGIKKIKEKIRKKKEEKKQPKFD